MIPPEPAFPSSKTKNGALYLDNAATSWPKPPGVARSMVRFLEEVGANPGRSGHRLSIEAARIVFDVRERIAVMFSAADPLRVVFGQNVTDAINMAMYGLLKPGDHVITTGIEHNAVMRPLRALAQQSVSFTQAPCEADGTLDPALVEQAIRSNTRMVVLNQASNVCGTLLPVREIGQIARRHDLLFLVDAAQSAGVVPIDMVKDRIDLLAFTGHKSLYGPMGTGGLVVGERVSPVEFHPSRQGGTGSRSEREEQPDFFPDRLESGTPNAVGLAGLQAALEWMNMLGLEAIRRHELALCAKFIDAMETIPGVVVYGTKNPARQTATVAFNIRGIEPSTVGMRLDEEFNILCRVGLHCAPSAHRTLGTFPGGCIRFGFGVFNTLEDIDQAVAAVRCLAKEVV